MPTISSKVSKKELDAIQEYANACGETVSNLIRKSLIKDCTFMNGFGGLKDYEYSISIPDNCSGEEENTIVKNVWNRCRRVLGFEEIDKI